MKCFQLHAEQYLDLAPEAAWEFFSDPVNLQRITPPHMGFQILGGADRPMYSGQVIHYRVSPFPGYATRWVTEITHVQDGSYFVDEQRFGPYALWHHKHFIEAVDGGVKMVDIVDYKLPFGWLGILAHRVLVKRQLREIFDFRRSELERRFGNLPGKSPVLRFKSL